MLRCMNLNLNLNLNYRAREQPCEQRSAVKRLFTTPKTSCRRFSIKAHTFILSLVHLTSFHAMCGYLR